MNVRLDEVVLRALQREPERRYQSASDLEHGVTSAGAAAAPAGAGSPEARTVARPETAPRGRRAPILLLGLATLLPATTLALTLAMVLAVFSEMAAVQESLASATLGLGLSEALAPALLGGCVAMPLVAFYVWHAATRAKLEDGGARVIWVAVLIFLAPFSMPVYCYSHVWARARSTEPRSRQ